MAWRDVRRVREVKTRVGLFDLLLTLRDDEPAASLLDAARQALALSPLTDVALAERPAAVEFRWTSPGVNAVGDPALRGALVRLALARGSSGSAERSADAALGRIRAIERATVALASGDHAPPTAVRALVRLHLELLATEALGRGAAPAGHALGWDLLARLGLDRAAECIGLDRDTLARALELEDRPRGPQPDALAAALLARAGPLEDSP